jgi:hypothetical protein
MVKISFQIFFRSLENSFIIFEFSTRIGDRTIKLGISHPELNKKLDGSKIEKRLVIILFCFERYQL